MKREAIVGHIPRLRRYARSLTGDAWAADDLVQDTLERACSKWRLWTPGSDLRAWLFTLMHNLYVNQVRSTVRRAGQVTEVALDDVQDELADPSTVVGHQIDLQRCLLLLPEEQRAVLLLVSVEDLSYVQVAKIVGAPLGTVMSRLSRARSRLRELMEPTRPGAQSAVAVAPPVLRRLK